MATSDPRHPVPQDPPSWHNLSSWLDSRLGPQERPPRYAKAYGDLLERGDEPTQRQLTQASDVWHLALELGYANVPVEPPANSALDAPTAAAVPSARNRATPLDSSEPTSRAESVGAPEGALSTIIPSPATEGTASLDESTVGDDDLTWDDVTRLLEGVLLDMPDSSWFAIWVSNEADIPSNDGLSFMTEVRVFSNQIALRCLGPQHLRGPAQFDTAASRSLLAAGWQPQADPHRMLRFADLPLDDDGAALAARQMVALLKDIYGRKVASPLFVETTPEVEAILRGRTEGLNFLPPEHFNVTATM